MTKAKKQVAALAAAAAPTKRKPGRPRGSLGKKTIAMREAIASVFDELQAAHKGPGTHPDFLAWAKDNRTEFYRMAVRTLPLQIEATATSIGLVVFRGLND